MYSLGFASRWEVPLAPFLFRPPCIPWGSWLLFFFYILLCLFIKNNNNNLFFLTPIVEVGRTVKTPFFNRQR